MQHSQTYNITHVIIYHKFVRNFTKFWNTIHYVVWLYFSILQAQISKKTVLSRQIQHIDYSMQNERINRWWSEIAFIAQ
jgi:hypothetical protein